MWRSQCDFLPCHRFPGWSGIARVCHFYIHVVGIEYPAWTCPWWLQLPEVWAVEWMCLVRSILLWFVKHLWAVLEFRSKPSAEHRYSVWCSKGLSKMLHTWQRMCRYPPKEGLGDKQQDGWTLWWWIRAATYHSVYWKILTSPWRHSGQTTSFVFHPVAETLCRNLCLHGTELSPRTQKWHIHSQVTLGSPEELYIHQGQLFFCSILPAGWLGKQHGRLKLFWGKLSHFQVFAKVGFTL